MRTRVTVLAALLLLPIAGLVLLLAVPGLDVLKFQNQKVRHYRNRCREMGITPDPELIEKILDPEIDFVVGVEAG